MDINIDLNILESEPADHYHAQADRYLSSHQLLDFIKCPWLHRKKTIGLIEESESASYLIGRAAHTRILEGPDALESDFALGGPINEKTGKPFGAATKAFAEWAASQGEPVLSHDQVDLIEQMAAGVDMNDEALALLLFGRAEGVVRAEYCNTPCQIRIDWTNPGRGIVDLKTCDDLTWFEADARRYGYHRHDLRTGEPAQPRLLRGRRARADRAGLSVPAQEQGGMPQGRHLGTAHPGR